MYSESWETINSRYQNKYNISVMFSSVRELIVVFKWIIITQLIFPDITVTLLLYYQSVMCLEINN